MLLIELDFCVLVDRKRNMEGIFEFGKLYMNFLLVGKEGDFFVISSYNNSYICFVYYKMF